MSDQGASRSCLGLDHDQDDESQSQIPEIKKERIESSSSPVSSMTLRESSNITPQRLLIVRSQNLSGATSEASSAITKSWSLDSYAVQSVPVSHSNTAVTEVSSTPTDDASTNKNPRYLKMLYSFPVSMASDSIVDGKVHMTVPGHSEPVPLVPVICYPKPSTGAVLAKDKKTGHRTRRQERLRSKKLTVPNKRCAKVKMTAAPEYSTDCRNTVIDRVKPKQQSGSYHIKANAKFVQSYTAHVHSQQEACRREYGNGANSFVTSVADRIDLELKTGITGTDDHGTVAAVRKLHDLKSDPVDADRRCTRGSNESIAPPCTSSVCINETAHEYSEDNEQGSVKLELNGFGYFVSLNENLHQGHSDSDPGSADQLTESDIYSQKRFESTKGSDSIVRDCLYGDDLTKLRSSNLTNSETDCADECETTKTALGKEKETETCDTVICDRIKTEMASDSDFEDKYRQENESVDGTRTSDAQRRAEEISKPTITNEQSTMNTRDASCVVNEQISVGVIQRYLDFVSSRALSVTHRVELELEKLRIQDFEPQVTDTEVINVEDEEDQDEKNNGDKTGEKSNKPKKAIPKPKPSVITKLRIQDFGPQGTDTEVINVEDEEDDDDDDDHDEENNGDKTEEKSNKPKKAIPKSGVITFTTEELYLLLIEETEAEYTCRNCSMVFSDKEHAQSHVNSHSPYRCVSCNMIFPSVGPMKNHCRIVHEETLHCNFCLYSTKHKSDFERHVKSEHKQSRIQATTEMVCYVCGVFCQVWEPIDDHLEKEHGIERSCMAGDFLCPLCNAILRSKQSFRVHMRKHRGEYQKCSHPDCEYRSANPYLLRNHYKSVHVGNRKFSCPFEGCETKFKNRYQVREHLNVVHHKIRKFFCNTCGKGFLAKKHLSVHERIHSDFKPIGCKFCDYRCRQTASLKWHMKQSHPEELDSETSTAATIEGSHVKHCLKRGRKTTQKKKCEK